MKDQILLTIDTHLQRTSIITLKIGEKEFTSTSEALVFSSQMVLPQIESLLVQAGKQLTDITAIIVDTGPGSFTGLRVGISVANCLSTQLQIPVNGKFDLADTVYTE